MRVLVRIREIDVDEYEIRCIWFLGQGIANQPLDGNLSALVFVCASCRRFVFEDTIRCLLFASTAIFTPER